MLAEEFFQVAAVQVFFLDELQPHDVVARAGVVEVAVGAEIGRASCRERVLTDV